MKNKKNKNFDCIEFKNNVQAQIYNEIKNLSWEDEKLYFEENAKNGSFAKFNKIKT